MLSEFSRRRARVAVPVVVLFVALSTHASRADERPESVDGEVSFERDVWPIFRERCTNCHGPKRQRGGLRLDASAAALRGGDSGAVIVPGKSDESRLIALVAGLDEDGDVMPPKGERLSAREVATLRRWIDSGAEWPEDAEIEPLEVEHWSFQPIEKPTPPKVNEPDWCRSPLDAFVLARLEGAGLRPAPEADRATLARRLWLVLLGLPPSPEDIDAFCADESPHAYERLVDRLLESPHYGERWGRHWLDVVRFTESQGFEYDRIRDNAWHYRDWVIEAFNRDLPYDRFVAQQIAGDVIEPVSSETIIATSFLVCGPWDQAGSGQANLTQRRITREEEMEGLVAVVSQSFLGLTVNCARCHSHKYDPIPQTDYYRVRAVFDGVVHGERDVSSAAENSERQARVAELTREIEALEQQRRTIDELGRERALARRRVEGDDRPLGPQPQHRWAFEGDGKDSIGDLDAELVAGARVENGRLIVDGKGAIAQTGLIDRSITAKTLEVWVALPTLDQGGGGAISIETPDGASFDAIVFGERQARKWIAGSDGFRRTRDLDAPAETAGPGELVQIVIVYDDRSGVTVYRNGEPYGERYVPSAPLRTYDAGSARIVFGLRHTGGGRAYLRGEIELAALYDRALSQDEVRDSFRATGLGVGLENVLDALTAAEKEARSRLVDATEHLRGELRATPKIGRSYVGQRRQPEPTRIFVKGNVRDPGDVVAPGALSAISIPEVAFDLAPDAPEGERRERFARWVASPANPLTPRVIVNRVWRYHFGRGFVSTPNDFGAAGDRPSHPELLDWLASAFLESGQSLKALHRLILNSATFRQSTEFRPDAAEKDAENRLLWRFSTRRLEAEAIRDAVLTVSGRLERRRGGPSFRPFKTSSFGSTFYEPLYDDRPEWNRRSVYRMNVNSGKDPLLDVLDCPDPAVKTPRRRHTTTPLQALSLMNNTFVRREASFFAQRLLEETDGGLDRAVDHAFAHAFGRPPIDKERAAARELATRHGLETLCWALLNASEFLYVR